MPTPAILPTVDAALGCWSNLKCFSLPTKKEEKGGINFFNLKKKNDPPPRKKSDLK